MNYTNSSQQKGKKGTCGVITLGFGAREYVKMARGLGRSIRRLNPEIPLAVVSDASQEMLKPFDYILPFNAAYGDGVTQKLHLDKYSPFDETLFIDSDCLVYRPLEQLWEFYRKSNGFGVAAWGYINKESDYNFIENIEKTFQAIDIERMPHFNGGVYYFDSSKLSKSVFKTAREFYAKRNELGFTTFKNSPVADEPVIALAMSANGVEPLPFNESKIMNTAIGYTENLDKVDVRRGTSRYKKNGNWVEPAVIHFNIGMQRSYVYQRELHRLAYEHSFLGSARASILGRAKSIRLEGKRKLDGAESRIREIGLIGMLPGRILRQLNIID